MPDEVDAEPVDLVRKPRHVLECEKRTALRTGACEPGVLLHLGPGGLAGQGARQNLQRIVDPVKHEVHDAGDALALDPAALETVGETAPGPGLPQTDLTNLQRVSSESNSVSEMDEKTAEIPAVLVYAMVKLPDIGPL